ncbi:hypothetical protein [Arthrobacter flavus]|uniref:ABC transporter permease n=1 Tax=Arthrobacter flavus TaxID=95172 RepID=A0ABW4QAI4_9MICC
MSRVVNVMRMQLSNRWTFIGIPAVILLGSFGLSWVIWSFIPFEGAKYSGGSQAIMWYFLALGIQSLTLTFPFSQGLSISRKSFFLGTVGLFSIIAAVTTALYYVLGLIEIATDGWGLNGRFFALEWIAEGSGLPMMVFYFTAMMALFLIGFWAATIYKRWQTTGLLITGIGTAVLLVGLVYYITRQELWGQVGQFLSSQTQLSVAGWLAVVGLALAGGSYLTLRRAVP